MELRAGYKQTDVGVIPSEWDCLAISSVFHFKQGVQIPVERQSDVDMDGYKRFIRIVDVTDPNVPFRYIADPGAAHHVMSEDLFMVRYGSPGLLGFGYRGVIANNLFRLIPKRPIVAEFYGHYLRSRQADIVDLSGSSTMPAVNFSTLSVLALVWPPIREQRVIATALSDVDALLAKIDQLIAKKRNLKQAAMQQLLTGQTRLPGFSGDWEVKRLEDVLSRMANGAVYKATNSRGIQITRIETIADGTIDYLRTGIAEYSTELERYKVMPGDILFSHINSVDHIGKVAIYKGEQPLYHGMNLLLLRTNTHADCNFIYLWFTSLPARRLMRNLAKQAVSQASINTKELKALEMRLPALPEQTAIAVVLSDMGAELAALEARRDKTRALKQGMMQALLTGRIRLIAAN